MLLQRHDEPFSPRARNRGVIPEGTGAFLVAPEPVSIRAKNPGALNATGWVRELPGFVMEQETTPGNRTAFFATEEDGVAAWWELLRRYRDLYNTNTVGGIVNRYGGGQDYSEYAKFVEQHSKLPLSSPVSLDNDRQLLALARAMFWYEAGKPSPLTDRQITQGFNLGRRNAAGAPNSPGGSEGTGAGGGLLGLVLRLLAALFRRK